jgi:hypothetical protein
MLACGGLGASDGPDPKQTMLYALCMGESVEGRSVQIADPPEAVAFWLDILLEDDEVNQSRKDVCRLASERLQAADTLAPCKKRWDVEGLPLILDAENLRSLDFSRCFASDTALLSQLTTLERLVITRGDLRPLASLKRLEDLSADVQIEKADVEGLRALVDLPLRRLRLPKNALELAGPFPGSETLRDVLVVSREDWLDTELTDRFELLGIHSATGEAAVRITTRPQGWGMTSNANGFVFNEGVDCDYAGMEDYPYSGVDLVRVKLGGAPLAGFTVYARADLEGYACTPHDVSEQRLAQAKADFSAHGLGFEGIAPTAENPDWEWGALREPREECYLAAGGHRFCALYRDGGFVIVDDTGRVRWTWQGAADSSASLWVNSAWTVDEGVVLAVKQGTYDASMSNESWYLSPILPLD